MAEEQRAADGSEIEVAVVGVRRRRRTLVWAWLVVAPVAAAAIWVLWSPSSERPSVRPSSPVAESAPTSSAAPASTTTATSVVVTTTTAAVPTTLATGKTVVRRPTTTTSAPPSTTQGSGGTPSPMDSDPRCAFIPKSAAELTMPNVVGKTRPEVDFVVRGWDFFAACHLGMPYGLSTAPVDYVCTLDIYQVGRVAAQGTPIGTVMEPGSYSLLLTYFQECTP